MDRKNYKKNFVSRFGSYILALAIFAAVLVFVLSGLGDARDSAASESLRLAEQSVRRAAVSCYAIEGRYPDSYEHLKEYYGVNVDESKYTVFYEVFASNLMPSITVVKKEGAG